MKLNIFNIILFLITILEIYTLFQFNSSVINLCLYFLIFIFIITNILLLNRNKILKNYKLIEKVLKIMNILIIAIINLIFVLILFLLICLTKVPLNDNSTKEYKNIKYYETELKYINKKRIKHFPTKIPVNSENIKFYSYTNSWFGSQIFCLGFDIDKNYIEQEIRKNNYINIIKPFDKNIKNYSMQVIQNVLNTNLNNYYFYIIGNNTSDKNGHYSMEYGIAIKDNCIIYYYINTD